MQHRQTPWFMQQRQTPETDTMFHATETDTMVDAAPHHWSLHPSACAVSGVVVCEVCKSFKREVCNSFNHAYECQGDRMAQAPRMCARPCGGCRKGKKETKSEGGRLV
mmetsp:Transcript_27400/g.44048  ORF Transcript_27400/g.44048 Transcript_27400/m.44048 type:complete len:108 (-) Transcript_27400:67-390(-)